MANREWKQPAPPDGAAIWRDIVNHANDRDLTQRYEIDPEEAWVLVDYVEDVLWAKIDELTDAMQEIVDAKRNAYELHQDQVERMKDIARRYV